MQCCVEKNTAMLCVTVICVFFGYARAGIAYSLFVFVYMLISHSISSSRLAEAIRSLQSYLIFFSRVSVCASCLSHTMKLHGWGRLCDCLEVVAFVFSCEACWDALVSLSAHYPGSLRASPQH